MCGIFFLGLLGAGAKADFIPTLKGLIFNKNLDWVVLG